MIVNPNVTVVYQCLGVKTTKILYVAFINNFDDEIHANMSINGTSYNMSVPCGKWGCFSQCDISEKKCNGEPIIKFVEFPINYAISISFRSKCACVDYHTSTFPNAFPINAYNINMNEIYGICNPKCSDEIRFYPGFPLCFDNQCHPCRY